MKINKKGFTLVELLAVLVVLGLVAAICYPMVTKTIATQKEKLGKEQKNRVISAAKNYVASNVLGDEECITVAELQSSGFLEAGDIEDPNSGGTLNGGVKIVWDDSNNQYTYTYVSSGC